MNLKNTDFVFILDHLLWKRTNLNLQLRPNLQVIDQLMNLSNV